MEDVPPSYQSAVDRDAWNVIAPWIPSRDLCSASVVCRKWHAIFIPLLWGDPASHFGTHNDAVYVALTRFKRTLPRARLSVRQLTHTLCLPPALSEIYGGPNPTWLRDVLDHLPNLQSLLVSKLPFFDHHSLVALVQPSSARATRRESEASQSTYGLKLLLAAREPNTTSLSIADALPHFPHLVYLDLSYTTPARDAYVLSALSSLHHLQVLKLRGIGLRDGEAEVLANAVGLRVRLLDLRENQLTDMAVRSLMQSCFLPPDRQHNGNAINTRAVEDWPIGMAPGPDFLSLDSLRSEELDKELLMQLTHPLTGRLAFEDIPHNGVTHLYIADNRLSVEGLASLAKSTRLHVLDAGSVDPAKTINRTKSRSSSTGYHDRVVFSEAERLVPILATHASSSLTYLRVNHSIITKPVPTVDSSPPSPLVAELPDSTRAIFEAPAQVPAYGAIEAPAPARYPVELSSEAEPIFELSAEPATSRHELPGDCIHFALSPPMGNSPLSQETGSEDVFRIEPRRGSGVFAPEPVLDGNDLVSDHSSEDKVVLNASGSGLTARKSSSNPNKPVKTTNTVRNRLDNHFTKESIPISPLLDQSPHQSSLSLARQQRIESLMRKRPFRVENTHLPTQSIQSPTPPSATHSIVEFHPSLLPHLRAIVLTGVPTMVTPSSQALILLRKFISACADEAALALLQAQTNYSLPPGRARHVAEMQHASSLFALREIVLEMAPPPRKGKNGAFAPVGPKGWVRSHNRASLSKSSTGDRDSEALWSAAENDFSFFGEEGEEQDECGIYQHDPDKYFPTAGLDEKMVVDGNRDGEGNATYMPGSPRGSPTGMDYGGPVQSPAVLHSPRNLPLGRNRRSSSSASPSLKATTRATLIAEMPGSMAPPPTSHPRRIPTPDPVEELTVDLVAELAKFRRARKAEFEENLLQWRIATNPHNNNNPSSYPLGGQTPVSSGTAGNAMNHNTRWPGVTTTHEDVNKILPPFVEGYWKGEVKIIRNSAPKGRTGMVDIYGNYFEKGYLYP